MILIEFLFAPTVPSAPEPKKTTTHGLGVLKRRMKHPLQGWYANVVIDAHCKVILWRSFLFNSSRVAFTIAGVNSWRTAIAPAVTLTSGFPPSLKAFTTSS